MATTISAPFGTLPHYLQQRVLAGVPFHDHQVTAASCKAFRAIMRGTGFLALRQRHGFAERVVVVVGNTHLAKGVRLVAVKPGQMTKEESALSGLRPISSLQSSFEEARLAKLLRAQRPDHRIPTKRKRICTSRRRLLGHLRRRRGCWPPCIWVAGPPALRLRIRPPRLGLGDE